MVYDLIATRRWMINVGHCDNYMLSRKGHGD